MLRVAAPEEAAVSQECVACRLIAGELDLPGGRIFQTEHWVVEHCIGSLGVGTLILKPFRHIVGLADLSSAEAAPLGLLLQRTSSIIRTLTESDQIYTCLWSHADWRPGHIHFVLQPVWNSLQSRYPGPGPVLQMAMFKESNPLDRGGVQAFCDRARAAFESVA
jgi:diadenosine tetraphosphate (Ap4A) HIT family hydrolase